MIKQQLEELGLEQRDLAGAAEVTESYISQLLTVKKLPPEPNRSDIYDKIGRFLKLPSSRPSKLADHQRKEVLKRNLEDPHISIVRGEPLVRYRELEILLPKLADMGVEVQLVTSAVRPVPTEWRSLQNLHLVVSVDGLQPEHDKRRSPATYDRILNHIAGHRVTIHCTTTLSQ